MNQTNLNAIALLVFGVTFLILLGPFLEISPLWPTLITGTLLGLITLDRLGLEGQGLTVVLDTLAQRSPQHRQRIIHHEAGHFLVAHCLGITVTGYSLSAWSALKAGHPGRGGVQFAPPELNQEQLPLELVDRYCTVWMAGGAAEVLVYDSAIGGDDDLDRLRTTLRQLGLDWRSRERAAVLEARRLLQTHWATYEALVVAMTQTATISECYEILEKTNLTCQT